MKNQYEQKRKAVIATMSVAILSLLGGIGYCFNQKIDNSNSNKNKGKSQPYNGQIKGDMIYVEGFGWVKYSGGGSIVHEAPNAGTGEVIADM